MGWSNSGLEVIQANTVIVSTVGPNSGIFVYSGVPATGNLVGSWTSVAGTDSFGNAYGVGLSLYSSSGLINFSTAGGDIISQWLDTVNLSEIDISVGGGAAVQEFVPPAGPAAGWEAASLAASISNVFGANTAQFTVRGAYNKAHASTPTLTFFGSSDSSSQNRLDLATQQFNVSGDVTAGSMDSGTFSITPTVASQWTANAAVSFNKTFSSAPVVMVTPSGGGPGTGTATVLEWQTTGITTTGFSCRIMRGNLTATTLSYLAVLT